jgi:hypothetical protein
MYGFLAFVSRASQIGGQVGQFAPGPSYAGAPTDHNLYNLAG